ncbi:MULTISPECIES: Dyp-type peroxidase [Pannonibacter]|uniref:Dyp-type peroxidase n=1 Tax=Pannonibacter TaxID=227873 RepID=UPI000F02C615|nr:MULTISPECIES: hypothetical protein [Pannonibacter]
MTVKLDLADIQGNILAPYGKQGYPKARYFTLRINDPAEGRRFVETIRRKVTTAASLPGSKGTAVTPPEIAINIAFTFSGLFMLDVPTRTLQGFPDEFIDGMPKRCMILGDDGPAGSIKDWDPVWRTNGEPNLAIARRIHMLVTLNARMTVPDALEKATANLRALCAEHRVEILAGHGGPNPDFQEVTVIYDRSSGHPIPTPKEHFGFTDGISDPVFHGQYGPETEKTVVVGNGKLTPDQTWEPLATGEFLLGYPDEAQEVPGAAMPLEFSRNGTFIAYRKLHENVATFKSYMSEQAELYARIMGVPQDEAYETLMAKFAGRWSDGIPLILAPTYQDWISERWNTWRSDLLKAQIAGDDAKVLALSQVITDYDFKGDPNGTACPITAHTRRMNTRDNLDPGYGSAETRKRASSVLNNRRRILRRGLPYGASDPAAPTDDGDHGVLMLIMCASLFRQFEFVQQQWINYGLDFNAGNDTCPILGRHDAEAKFVIAVGKDSGKPPFIAARLPQFVTMRGGDYFFVPSMTALRMLGMGIIDPT